MEECRVFDLDERTTLMDAFCSGGRDLSLCLGQVGKYENGTTHGDRRQVQVVGCVFVIISNRPPGSLSSIHGPKLVRDPTKNVTRNT